MKLDKEKLLARDPSALAELHRVCRECARIGASKAGALDFLDDIVQEVMLKLLTEWIHDYNPERDVEPTLIVAADYVGKDFRRRHSKEVLIGGEGGEDGLPDFWANNVADPSYEDPGDRIDRERKEEEAAGAALFVSAVREFNSAIGVSDEGDGIAGVMGQGQSVSDDSLVESRSESSSRPRSQGRKKTSTSRRSVVAPDNAWDAMVAETSPSGRPPAKQKRPLSKDAMRLREIRLAVRYTHENMASHLGLASVSQLHAIEYGITLPPDGLVQKAEVLLKMIQETAPDLMKDDFSEIVQGWLKRLGLAPDDYGGFARAINEVFAPRRLNRSTVFRWLKGTYKPSPDLLWKIEAAVQLAEARRSEILKVIPKTA